MRDAHVLSSWTRVDAPNTQSCKYTACSGPQPLIRTARPAKAKRCTFIQGPGGRARSPSETWLSQQGPG
eukprot:2240630-Prymnesium_polylepis.1